MRLSNFEKQSIIDTIAIIDSDADIYLYGSRCDDNKGGGDIDIMENLTSRYSRAVDLIISKIFRSIDAVELEESGTILDIVNRAEKRGLIDSSKRLRELKDLRNEIVHEYETDDLFVTFEAVRNNVPEILSISQNIKDYCNKRNYIKSL